LIDIVCDSAGSEVIEDRSDITALKKRGFNLILDHEERDLVHSKDLIAALRAVVAAMGSDSAA
jgi:hypothetical protein